MEIKEALSQIRQVSSVLEAFKSLDEILTLAELSQEQIENLEKTKESLQGLIVSKGDDLSRLEENYRVQYEKLTSDFDKAKEEKKRALKELRDTSQKEFDAIQISSNAKIEELNVKVRGLSSNVDVLSTLIEEKQKLLASLNKSIEEIKARLVN